MLHRANDDTLSLCPVLLERGVDVNALTIEGWSPLAFALNRNVAIREEKRGLTRADLSEKETLSNSRSKTSSKAFGRERG